MAIAGSRAVAAGGAVAGADAAERSALRVALLSVLLIAAAALKLAIAPVPVGHHALDGSNYFQVARHVADGEGLATDVSLYHQGLRELPHASFVYPLWPLALGAAGAAVGIERAAVTVPPLLYLLSLGLLYALANRLARSFAPGGEKVRGGGGAITVGHLAVILFATNRVYFQHTSLPYSEGLAFSLAFASLLAFDSAGESERPSLGWSAAAGALAGLAYLARSQMAGLAVALPLARILSGGPRSRSASGAAALVCASSAGLVALPWALFLSSLPGAGWIAALFDFTAYRETPELAPFALTVRTDGPLAFLLDRAAGIRIALSPGHPFSYARSFGMSVYLVPLAAIAALCVRAARPRATAAPAARPTTGIALATALAAALCLVPVHLHHATYIWEWWFHWRHGLPLELAIVTALAWLLASGPRWTRLPALLLVAVTLATAPLALASVVRDFRARARGPHPDEVALLAWIAEQPRAPLLVATHPQVLAAFARGGRYHWIDCKDAPAQLDAMVRHLGVDGAVVYPGEERCLWAAALPESGATPRRFGALTLWTPAGRG